MFDHGITNRHLSMLTKHYHEHYHVYDNDIIRNPECRVSLNHWMALLLLPQFHFTHHSFPPCSLFLSLSLSLALSLRLLILCRRKIRIAREHNEDYQINIGDNLSLPSLLHGLSLRFLLLSGSVTHSLSVVNSYFHPLPFKSLIASG